MQTDKKNRGGARLNTGPKLKYGEPTKQIVIRCPKSKVEKMKTLINSKLSEWKENTINNETSVCPKCGSEDVIWTCYCNKCNECM